jgi:tetratricopeptide (TPR) repeat protein
MEIEIGEGRNDKLALIGPSMWGHVYQSKQGPACYRIIPILDAPFEKRNKVSEWIGKPRQIGIAPIVEADHAFVQGNGFFVMRYEISPNRTWAGMLKEAVPSVRFEFAVRILRCLPNWWANLIHDAHECLLPMPADIVFVEDTPYLLAMPYWGLPDLESVFFDSERALYLPPELVCGRQNQIWGRNIDIYALGVSLFQCLFVLPLAEQAGTLLSKIANASLFSSYRYESLLPYWLERFEGSQHAIGAVRRALDPKVRDRSAVEPEELARQLEDYLRQMEPAYVVTALRAKGRAEEAYTLLQDILLDQNTYDLLLLAGKIVWGDLHRPLEAIDLFERAVAKDGGRPEAFEEQFKTIVTAKHQIEKLLWRERKQAAIEELDNRMWRDFSSMPVKKQTANEADMARYLLWRKQYDQVTRFIYPRLSEGNTYQWWKFGITLAYAEAFMELGELEEAQRQMEEIKARLIQVKNNRAMPLQEIHQHGAALSELEVRLYKRRMPLS